MNAQVPIPGDAAFGISPEHKEIREAAARFASEIIAPLSRRIETEGVIPLDLRRRMGALGLIGIELPERYGGVGLDHVASGIVIEAIAEGDFNVAFVQLLASLCGSIISRHAPSELAREILPSICSGEKLVALALTEPQGGSDAAALRLKAERQDEYFLLTGEKTSISLADQADYAIVFARTDPASRRAQGISAFLVDLDAPGIIRTRFHDVGEHAVGRGSIFFDGARVPASRLLGCQGKGFGQVMQGFDFSRALIGLQCLAVARTSLLETWRYVSSRQSFGRSIVDNQGVAFPLAEFETYVEAARLLCYRTLAAKDGDLPHTREAAMCKWWAPKLAFDVVKQCLLLHGHAGYSRDLPFEQRLRDVLGLQIGDGTAQIMKHIIAREALRAI